MMTPQDCPRPPPRAPFSARAGIRGQSRRRWMCVGPMLVLLCPLVGQDTCGGDDDDEPTPPLNNWWDGLVLVSDGNGPRLSVLRLQDGALLWDYNAFDYHPDYCSNANEEPCLLWHAGHKRIGDRDVVDFTLTSNASGIINMTSAWRVPLDAPDTPLFEVSGFDFSGLSAGCTSSPDLTCVPQTAATLENGCSVKFSHDFRILEEDPEAGWIRFAIADSTNFRILGAYLDYASGSHCATVEWSLDASVREWDATCPPNAIQLVEDDTGKGLLVTCRNLYSNPGTGQIQMWRNGGTWERPIWSRAWSFPDPDAYTDPAFINTPHGGRIEVDSQGNYQLLYAHSNGLGTDWGEGDQGTVGTALSPSLFSPPNYLGDEWIGDSLEDPTFGFLRSVDLLPGGQRVVGDSRTFAALPDLPGRVYILSPQTTTDTADGGYWSQDFSHMNLDHINDQVLAVYECGWNQIFSAERIAPPSFGSYLTAAVEAEGLSCGL